MRFEVVAVYRWNVIRCGPLSTVGRVWLSLALAGFSPSLAAAQAPRPSAPPAPSQAGDEPTLNTGRSVTPETRATPSRRESPSEETAVAVPESSSPQPPAPTPDSVFATGTTLWFPNHDLRLSGLSVSQRRTYVGILANALRSGIPSGRAPTAKELERAHDSLEKARLIAVEPELEFVAGLIALAASDWTTSETHFQSVIRLSELSHPGGWTGAIYAQLAANRTGEALESCWRLAGVLAAADPAVVTPVLSTATATWLGRATACCMVTPAAVPPAPAEVREALPESLRGAFDTGYAAVASEKHQLLEWTRMSPTKLATETVSLRSRVQRELAQLRDQERSSNEQRRAVRTRQRGELKEVVNPLLHLARQLQVGKTALRNLDRQILVVSSRPIEVAVRQAPTSRLREPASRSRFGVDRESRLAREEWDREERLEEQRYRAALHRERQQRAQKAADLALLYQTRQLHLQAMNKLNDQLQQGKTARKQLEAEQAIELRKVSRETTAAHRSRTLAQRRLEQLWAALNDPAKLRLWAESPATWLPYHVEGQRDTLIAMFRQP